MQWILRRGETHAHSAVARRTRATACDPLPDHHRNTWAGRIVRRLPGGVVNGGARYGVSGVEEIASSKAGAATRGVDDEGDAAADDGGRGKIVRTTNSGPMQGGSGGEEGRGGRVMERRTHRHIGTQ